MARISRRNGPRTTHRQPQDVPVPVLVNHLSTADAPDPRWLADITYVLTGKELVNRTPFRHRGCAPGK